MCRSCQFTVMFALNTTILYVSYTSIRLGKKDHLSYKYSVYFHYCVIYYRRYFVDSSKQTNKQASNRISTPATAISFTSKVLK